MTAPADVTATGITKSFGTFRALKDLSLTIEGGEFLTLLGPSGSGKTTFLMILAGFEAPTKGRLSRGGTDITTLSAEERAFGMVFQGYALFPHMTVAQNIAFPLVVRRRPKAEIAARVARMVERVGLAGHEGKLPAKLSGGQQQRVALARALVFEPAMLLLDEPFSALDKHLRGLMQEEVRRLHREFGTTFVFVTHDQSEALSLSSRVAIFNHGEVLQVGTPKTVYERPENRFVAEFLGEINMLPLQGVGPDGAGAAGRFEDGALSAPARAGAGPNAVLAIRPEHMHLANGHIAEGENALFARVTAATYLGPATRLQLATPGGTPLTLTLPSTDAARAEPGGEVRVAWPKDKGFLLPGGGEPALPAALP
ncbi:MULTISPECIES: ABC transporter ATP-binding protein [unclassified Aureimonas]|uniref:ABC transporter ATP-binding protein n=1 Tax=unclassified Aureimonas TaxID=2615206 RepID=UPI0006F8945C|nr:MULTISPECIES: ABC transporter ATP-binding protein [unclassified Aureimonas]KQT68996.1 spermidine/putrescine ABC transporter [Aureimonas sp. Leaf460]KQT69227.1 spermidine/putrescine ABC transporter [Aureimonas sp. Leaf427]